MFVNKTPSTVKEYKDFLIFHNKKIKKLLTISLSLLIVLSLLIIIFDTVVGVVLALALIFIFVYFGKNYEKSLVKNIQAIAATSKFIGETVSKNYTFNDENIEVEITDHGESFVQSTYLYSAIFNAYENDNYFYLYVSKVEAFIIAKNSMTVGTAEQLSEFLKSKQIAITKIVDKKIKK